MADVKECHANPNNWRLHPPGQYAAMEAAVEEVGWVRGVLINERTGNMVDGHLRILIALRKGEEKIPADWIDVSEEDERKILLSLDPIAAMATTNKKRLAMLNENTRFRQEALQELQNKNIKKAGLDDILEDKIETWEPSEDKASKLQEKWKTELGQIWQAGPHKIMCADSTDPEAWTQLMKGERAQLIFTEPPYGVDYTSKKLGKIENDALVDNKLTKMLIGSLEQAIAHTEKDAAFYIWHATSTRRDFEYAMDQVGLQEKQYLIWVKDNFTRIVVSDEEGNEGVIYLFDNRGGLVKEGMRIKIEKGYSKTFGFSGETALTVTKKGTAYVIL